MTRGAEKHGRRPGARGPAGVTPAPAVSLAVVLAWASPAPAQEPVPTPPGPGYAVETTHPVCRERRQRWARDGTLPDGPLGFGTPFVVAGTGADPATVPTDGLALGVHGVLEDGPARAGATVDDAAPGEDPRYRYPGPRDVSRADAFARVRAVGARGRWTAAVDLSARVGEVVTHRAGLGAVAGPVRIWAGALGLRAGPTCDRSLVLGGGTGPAWGLELQPRRPLRLPGVGEVRGGVQVGALPEAGPGNRHPLLHAMRLELRPGDDWVVGLSRAAVFGGSATDIPVTPHTVGLMLLGIPDARGKDSDFENQVAAVDVQWRSALAGRVLLVSAEWATDDLGATLQVPALRLAAQAEWTPWLAGGWTGLELVHFQPRTKTFPSWYHHGALSWGWTDRGEPLGHPLGGHGSGILLTQTWSSPTGSLEVAGGWLERGDENLFSPDLEGDGAYLSASWLRRIDALEVRLSTRVERWGDASVTAATLLYRF